MAFQQGADGVEFEVFDRLIVKPLQAAVRLCNVLRPGHGA